VEIKFKWGMGTFLIFSRQLSSRVGASTVEMYICVCVCELQPRIMVWRVRYRA